MINASAIVGANVRAELDRLEIPRLALAAKLELSKTAIYDRLRGHLNWDIDELVIISDWLDVPLDQLLKGLPRS